MSRSVDNMFSKGSIHAMCLREQDPTYFSKQEPTYSTTKAASIERCSKSLKQKHISKHFIGCPEMVEYKGNEVVTNSKSEHTAGGTLHDLIAKKKKLTETEAKEYLRMILRELYAIHAKGFVHADLKPRNILVFPQRDGKMKLKIADLGCSMRCGDKHEKDSFELFKFKGTPTYMSPESVTTPEFNTALDIWSLGCTLIKMVSGKSVWRHCSDRTELITKLVLDAEVPKIPKQLSREGRDFIRKCFYHEPTQRWTADMLLQHPYLKQQMQVPPNINHL